MRLTFDRLRSFFIGLSIPLALLFFGFFLYLIADALGGACIIKGIICPPPKSVPEEVLPIAHIFSNVIWSVAIVVLSANRAVSERCIKMIFGKTIFLEFASRWFRISFVLLLVSDILGWTQTIHIARRLGWTVIGSDWFFDILFHHSYGSGMDMPIWISDNSSNAVYLSDFFKFAFLGVYFWGLVWLYDGERLKSAKNMVN